MPIFFLTQIVRSNFIGFPRKSRCSNKDSQEIQNLMVAALNSKNDSPRNPSSFRCMSDCPSRLRRDDHSKRRTPVTERHSITFQKTGFVSIIAMRNSNFVERCINNKNSLLSLGPNLCQAHYQHISFIRKKERKKERKNDSEVHIQCSLRVRVCV